ncbi:MAG: AAA family ATPase [Aestuariivita sp.]|nr:AAA family ATPase [Aestuariivita sp.]
MTHQRLPISIQDFEMIRNGNFYYVDKTPLIRRLVENGNHYFLSRPRRFGKSLLVDTIGALFAGQETLFKGLDIHQHWDWSVTHPVVRISFDRKYDLPEDIEQNLNNQLDLIAHSAGLKCVCNKGAAPERLQCLLYHLHYKTGQRVAVLVDEYDKPILDVIRDPEQARANREYLCSFYGIIKGSAKYVCFVFITGVSMFSKISLFSDLNNLKDISLDPRFATICGYTDTDLDTVFAPKLKSLDRNEIRTWYNGYSWLGEERVYNPFDVLLLFDERKFKPYWFRTGSPRFLFETMQGKSVNPLELEGRWTDETLVSKFEINDIEVEALLFQTGYLTIVDERSDGFDTLYKLDYPNQEVQISLNRGLLQYLGKPMKEAANEGRDLCALLTTNDFEGFMETLKAYLASIPYQWHTTGNLPRYEAWYASLLHMSFRAIGVDVRSEDPSSHGRADMVVLTGGQVFIFEFKMSETADKTEAALETAIAQMRERGYNEKYQDRKEPIHLIAIACGCEDRTLLDIRVESAG